MITIYIASANFAYPGQLTDLTDHSVHPSANSGLFTTYSVCVALTFTTALCKQTDKTCAMSYYPVDY